MKHRIFSSPPSLFVQVKQRISLEIFITFVIKNFLRVNALNTRHVNIKRCIIYRTRVESVNENKIFLQQSNKEQHKGKENDVQLVFLRFQTIDQRIYRFISSRSFAIGNEQSSGTNLRCFDSTTFVTFFIGHSRIRDTSNHRCNVCSTKLLNRIE